jgi:hypothetical protein
MDLLDQWVTIKTIVISVITGWFLYARPSCPPQAFFCFYYIYWYYCALLIVNFFKKYVFRLIRPSSGVHINSFTIVFRFCLGACYHSSLYQRNKIKDTSCTIHKYYTYIFGVLGHLLEYSGLTRVPHFYTLLLTTVLSHFCKLLLRIIERDVGDGTWWNIFIFIL